MMKDKTCSISKKFAPTQKCLSKQKRAAGFNSINERLARRMLISVTLGHEATSAVKIENSYREGPSQRMHQLYILS